LSFEDFSRNVSTKSSALFYGNSAVISVIPLFLFWRIHQMEPKDAWFIWAIAALGAAYLLAFAYKNVKFVLKHKIAQKREEAITREMTRKLADDKKMSKKERDERILWKKNEVADYEATTFAIFYNNALFLVIMLVLSFYILISTHPSINCLVSMLGASGLVALFSTGTK